MNFIEALKTMKQGAKVKLPSWGGYWYWDSEKETVQTAGRRQGRITRYPRDTES